VAGYPEKHFEAPSMRFRPAKAQHKVDMGADYVVTQMFYDNQKYIDYVRRCRQEGITVPIIPGLKPLTSKKQLVALPRSFYIDLPDDLVDAVEKCKDDAAVKQVGIEWCIQQSKELMEFGVPVLHYYTMSKSDATKKIATALF
jgi:methylenetetrahydrofolate reductase (NADPH)